jgi:hypothetical protein
MIAARRVQAPAAEAQTPLPGAESTRSSRLDTWKTPSGVPMTVGVRVEVAVLVEVAVGGVTVPVREGVQVGNPGPPYSDS